MLEEFICMEQSTLPLLHIKFIVHQNFLNENLSRANLSEALYSNASLETNPPCLLPTLSESFFTCIQNCIQHLARSSTPAPAAHDAQIYSCRNSSGFSRGASMYRGVTRWVPCSSLLAHICTPPAAFSNTQNF